VILDAFNEHVRIYPNDSAQLSALGTVLHNYRSRSMWSLLANNPKRTYHLKEMARIIEKQENPRLSIYEYHIKIMMKSKILIPTTKIHNKHDVVFYRAAPFVLLSPPQYYKKALTSETLNRAFSKVFELQWVQ